MENTQTIVRLIHMTIAATRISVWTRECETDTFIINKELNQGDALPTTLFNLALKYVSCNRKIWYTANKREASHSIC